MVASIPLYTDNKDPMHLKLDVAVGSEVEDGDHDKGQVDPEVVAKDDGKRVLLASGVGNLKCAPT